MVKSIRTLRVVGVLIALGVQPAAAQTAEPAGAPAADALVQVAEQIAVMEDVLAQAVYRGAQAMEQQLAGAVPFPGLVLFAGPTQVRGFRLADYGVFFDVAYPVLRQSVFWSMQMLESDFEIQASLRMFEEALRENEQGVRGPARSTIGFAAPGASEPRPPGAANDESGAASEARSERPLVNPQELYREALEGRLVEVVLRHGGALAAMLDGDDWLTVTARDVRGLRGRDTTLRLWRERAAPRRDRTVRIKAADLAALRDGHLSLDETRARISVDPF